MKDKKVKLFSAIALVALALLVVGATYAYFQSQHGSASNADIKVTTNTTDLLTFETGDAINITADQETFAQGKGNRTGSTFARATLQANNKTNTAAANYYMYLNIETNTFTYTNTDKPELILQVVDKTSGNPVTSITGLNYVTVTDGKNTSISGFDITNKDGLIALFSNKEISASPKTIEEYTVTITLVNHNFDQNVNTGKNLSGKLIIQKEKIKTPLADYVISQYTGTQGENNIYYHDSNLTNGAGDNSYRYAGASADVKNYICLGSNETTCPDDNLYRIIGVFGDNNHGIKDQQLVKVIKNTSIGAIKWNTTESNDWASASLNTTLNSTFKTEKLSGFEDKIASVTWRVSEYNASDGTAKTAYTAEITNATKTYGPENGTSKIGLMYVSDYGYATTPDYWTTKLFEYDKAKSKDWLLLGSFEWLLSPNGLYHAWFVDRSGALSHNIVINTYVVRPSFYLLSSVKYESGDGTASSPIRVTDRRTVLIKPL